MFQKVKIVTSYLSLCKAADIKGSRNYSNVVDWYETINKFPFLK